VFAARKLRKLRVLHHTKNTGTDFPNYLFQTTCNVSLG